MSTNAHAAHMQEFPFACTTALCYASSLGVCFWGPDHVLIRQGMIGKLWWGEEPLFLGEGRHFLVHPTLNLEGEPVDVNSPHIQHGPLHLLRVDEGKLGYAVDTLNGQPMLLMAGTHIIKKATFKFKNFLDLTAKENKLGALTLVRVDRGWVAYVFKRGELFVLEPGMHVVVPPERFDGFESTQLQLLSLPTQTHESGDYVTLKIVADVLYMITDPKKAKLHVKDLNDLIRKMSTSTLAGIIRTSNLSEIAGSSRVNVSNEVDEDQKKAGESGSVPSFVEKLHDTFIMQLNAYMTKEVGVHVANIRIHDLRIKDAKLAASIAKEAVTIAEQEARFRMLQKETEIKQVEANNEKMEKLITASAHAEELRIQTMAQTDTTVSLAKAEAEKIRIVTEAKAKAKETMAKAEKAARALRGQGDKDYATLVSSTKLGGELAKMDVQSRLLAGIQKVAYVPQMPALLRNSELTFNVEGKEILA